MTWATPALDQPGDAALDVAASVMAGPEGWLTRELGTLAQSVDARQHSMRRASVFRVWITLSAGASPDAALAAVDAVVRRLAAGSGAEDVERARRAREDGRLLSLETTAARAFYVARSRADDPWGAHTYDGVTAEDVGSVVSRWLVPARRAVVVVHRSSRYPARGVALSRKERAP